MSWDVLGKADTNLIKYSEDFSQWSGTAPLTTESSDRFGGITLTTITDNLTTATRSRIATSSLMFETIANDSELCFSLFVEKDSTSKITRYPVMRFAWVNNTVLANMRFDTSTGETRINVSSGVSLLEQGYENHEDFFRFYFSCKYNGMFSSASIFPAFSNGELSGNTNTAITGSIKCFGAMLNYGRLPLPYRKTDGTEISWSGQSDDSQSWSTQSKKSTTWVTA